MYFIYWAKKWSTHTQKSLENSIGQVLPFKIICNIILSLCVLFPEMMIQNLQAVYLDKINISWYDSGYNENNSKCTISNMLAVQ